MRRMTISPLTYGLIFIYLYLSGAYIYHKSSENPLDTMCPEPYVCVIPDPEYKGLQLKGLKIYQKIQV